MRVALLTDGIFPYVIGGMQKHSFNLTKYFAKNKVFVDLYHVNSSNFNVSKFEFFSEDEKKYIRSFVIDFPSFGDFPGHYIRESFEYSNRIFNIFSENEEVDFIYAKGFSAWKLIDEKRKGYKCAPIGVNFHGYEMFQKTVSIRSKLEQKLLLRKPVLFNIENADYVFSYGGRITNLIFKLGIPQEKIIESPAGIEKDWLVPKIRSSQDIRKFIFVGRYERRKGIEKLTRVLSELAKKNNFEFYFVGDIPETKRLSLSPIKYLGEITNPKILKNIFRNCDVLVCSSYSEGMPNVILEAMASGLSIISTDVGAVDMLVSSKNGWLIRAGSSQELKTAFEEALNISAKKMDQLKSNSCIIAEKFVWDKIISHLLAMLLKTQL